MAQKYKGTETRTGYLYNVCATSVSLTESEAALDSLREGVFADANAFSALKLFFVSEEGQNWHTHLVHLPYFYVGLSNDNYVPHVKHFLERSTKAHVEQVHREDLSRPNHLPNPKLPSHATSRPFLKLTFANTDLMYRGLQHIQSVRGARHSRRDGAAAGAPMQFEQLKRRVGGADTEALRELNPDCLSYIEECYEADVKYVTRVLIDRDVRCAGWYEADVSVVDCVALGLHRIERTVLPPLNVLAWDIECFKAPLKFPDMEVDPIILISFMFNGQGYLLVNRTFVSRDIADFSYRPSVELSGGGAFKVYNEPDERALLECFFNCIYRLGVHIFVTYNGDNFDLPYVARRAQVHGLASPFAFSAPLRDTPSASAHSRDAAAALPLNLDCYRWVERDSYLPNGSRTLKQVCRIKLKYNPTEVDPEAIVGLASSDPQALATYSVSDAVATFYLYSKFIHNFVLALSSLIPLSVEEVMRQGSGTLCENLLMAEASAQRIIFPNKHRAAPCSYFLDPRSGKQHLIYDDSYVGGRVETLRCGLFRDDLEEEFVFDAATYQQLIDELPATLSHWARGLSAPPECPCHAEARARSLADPIVSTLHPNLHHFVNIREVYDGLVSSLTELSLAGRAFCLPRVIHLDVSAMYPNIILTHRLQPTAVVTEEFCSKCSFYSEASTCQRPMGWRRKLEISPVDRSHVLPILNELRSRTLLQPPKDNARKIARTKIGADSDSDASNDSSNSAPGRSNFSGASGASPGFTHKGEALTWEQLTESERTAHLVRAVKNYSLKTTRKSKLTREVPAESIVCQRENPFYVDTVRKFRDRRYVFKRNAKRAEARKHELLRERLVDIVALREAEEAFLINDSLQLAHKCILNSFYGYVKRSGSRWFSMEMGAIVTHMGAQIIESARKIIDGIGITIELDTDGIWCMLPIKFPFLLSLSYRPCSCAASGERGAEARKDLAHSSLEFPAALLNAMVDKKWANPQYLEFDAQREIYRAERKNFVEFELDGPWHAMFLPASDKSHELLKKRYVVYNHSKGISELKGFEIKRRGELKLIQRFQEEIFSKFVLGGSKREAFAAAAAVGARWRRAVDERAECLKDDAELFDLLVSRSVIKKSVAEQPGAKGFGITAAKRLSELLSNPMYVQDRNVSTQFLIANRPADADRTARAVPLQLFLSDAQSWRGFVSRWLRVSPAHAAQLGPRDVLDWDYYRERLDTQLLKLICIPALLQGLPNPIPSVPVPVWLDASCRARDPRQSRITTFFSASALTPLHDTPALPLLPLDVRECETAHVDYCETVHVEDCETAEPADSVGPAIDEIKKKWSARIQTLVRMGEKRDIYRRLYNFNNATGNLGASNCDVLLEKIDDLGKFFTHAWHIIDVKAMPRPGMLKCSLSLAGRNAVHSILLIAQRNVCLAFAGDPAELPPQVAKSARLLRPRRQFADCESALLALELEEETAAQVLFSITALLHNGLRGVYGGQTPLLFDFVARRGNSVTVDPGPESLLSAREPIFRARSLSAPAPGSAPSRALQYLSDARFYFVHIYATSPHLHRVCALVYSIAFPPVPPTGVPAIPEKCLLIAGGSEELAKSLVSLSPNALLEEFSKQFPRESGHNEGGASPHDYPCSPFPAAVAPFNDPVAFEHRSPGVACKNALEFLKKYLRELSKACKSLFIVTTSQNVPDLTKTQIETGKKETSWQENWQVGNETGNVLLVNKLQLRFKIKHAPDAEFVRLALKDSLERLETDFHQFEENLALSRIAKIPLNLLLNHNIGDCAKLALDLAFARSLSPGTEHHIAPISCDVAPHPENTKYADLDMYGKHTATMASPGIYRGYLVKVEFDPSIVFHSLRNHARASQAADGANGERLNGTNSERLKALGHALDVVAEGLAGLHGKITYKSFTSLFQALTNVCAWISDESSLLHDRDLYAQVIAAHESYLSHLLLQLHSRFGVFPVHVGPTFAVLDSGHVDVARGRQVVQLALETIKTMEAYEHAAFTLSEEYTAIVQLDERNFIRFRGYEIADGNFYENLPLLHAHPLLVREIFRGLAKEIALGPLISLLSSQDHDYRAGLRRAARELWTSEALSNSVRSIARSNLSDSSFSPSSHDLPIGGAKDSSAAPSLLARLLVQMLEIDSADLSADGLLQQLKDKFLRLMGAAQYSALAARGCDEARAHSLLGRDLCCSACFTVTRVSLSQFADPYECDHCGEPWDPLLAEAQLIEHLQELAYALNAQHSACTHCHHIRISLLADHCSCGHSFQDSLDHNAWLYALEVLTRIARKREFSLLESALAHIDSLVPTSAAIATTATIATTTTTATGLSQLISH